MIAVTGANGHLGQRLLAELAAAGPVRAVVRSRRAAEQVTALGLDAVALHQVDYRHTDALTDVLTGCSAVVHLVGIIREGAGNLYRDAHENASTAMAAAAARAGVEHIVYLSILGAAPDAANACLASRGAAEDILRQGTVPVTVLRVPMVLGERDYASAALARRAGRRFNVLLRGASLEQPIYAGDVVAAMAAAVGGGVTRPAGGRGAVLDLAGPESLTRADLVRRAAARKGNRTRILSLPLGLGMLAAGLLEKLSDNPPVTRAMLGVLDHDDRIDPLPAARTLGIELTALEEMLDRCL